MNIYVLRHEKRYIKPSFNTSLTNKGLEDAKKICEIIDKLNIDIIYCSPFKRIIQTIEPYLKKSKKKVNIEYGLYEFIHSNDFSKDDIQEINSDMYGYQYFNKKYKSVIKKINYLETLDDLKNRVYIFLDKIKKTNTVENILLVTHMSVVNMIINKKNNYHYPQGGLSLIYKNNIFKPINF